MIQVSQQAMKRTVWLLFCCQALMNAAVVGQAAMSALVGYSLVSSKFFATLPMAIQMTATMTASIPASIVFARLGRRAGFMLGAAGNLLGSLLFAAGIWQGDFTLYCIGSIPAGLGFGIAQQYRFAASEVATPDWRPRAIALVMAGGVLAALLGPLLVRSTKELLPPMLFLGTYLSLAVLPLVCMVLLQLATLAPPPPRQTSATPLCSIMKRPTFIVAAVSALVAYGSMNLLMAATPLEMMLCGFAVDDSTTVIGLHAAGMYAPGFVTGRLIQRFGIHAVMLTGALLSALCTAFAMTGASYASFVVALVLLGIGWNFLFVGATTLLGSAHSPEERMRAQAANDFLVFATVACTALGSGALHAVAGWGAINLTILPALAISAALIVWHRFGYLKNQDV